MFGPYRLDALLGRGGMGEVFRAFDTRKRGRVVALKLLPAHLSADEDFRARFKREAEITALLREPHVIPIHDYGEIDGQLYLDMRLVDGVNLAEVIDKDGPLPAARAVGIVEQVAAALNAANAEELIHRDVKPSNILVVREQPEFVYLVDFGIARGARTTARGRITGTNATIGTLEYMAPERFGNRPIDHRVDIYSLACVLFEALTGSPPFTGEAPKLIGSHIAEPVPRLAERRNGLPATLDPVIAKGMAKHPDDRYTAASDFAEAARDALPQRVGARSTRVVESKPGCNERPHVSSAEPATARGWGAQGRSFPWRVAGVLVVVATIVVSALLATRANAPNPSSPLSGPTPVPQVSVRTVPVSAQVPWNDTGIDVVVESEVVISAEGVLYIAGSDTGKTPTGAPGCVATGDRRVAPGPHLAPGLTCLALVGRIGDGAPFEVGRSVRLIAASSGRLQLAVNDNFFGDNSGAWTAHISVRAP